MTKEQQLQISGALLRYISKFSSIDAAAATLKGVSATTLQLVKVARTPQLSHTTWNNIAAQVGFYCGDWRIADTGPMLLMRAIYTDATYHRQFYGITAKAGTGKTTAALWYLKRHPGVCYLACTPSHNRRTFVEDLCNAAGIPTADDVTALYRQFLATLTTQDAPILLIDDVQKLKERALTLLADICESLYGTAGIVLQGNGEWLPKVGPLTAHAKMNRLLGVRAIQNIHVVEDDIHSICLRNGLRNNNNIAAIARQHASNLHGIQRSCAKAASLSLAA